MGWPFMQKDASYLEEHQKSSPLARTLHSDTKSCPRGYLQGFLPLPMGINARSTNVDGSCTNTNLVRKCATLPQISNSKDREYTRHELPAMYRIKCIKIMDTRITINIRSADPGDGYGGGDDLHSLRFLLYLPLDMPNIDIKLNTVTLYQKVGTIAEIKGSVLSSLQSEMLYETGLAFTQSYLLTIFKGI